MPDDLTHHELSASDQSFDREGDGWPRLILADVMLGVLVVALVGIAGECAWSSIVGGSGRAEIGLMTGILAAVGAGVVFAVRRLSWRAGLLLCLMFAMIATPADPTSMFLVGAPLVLVFAGARVTSRRRRSAVSHPSISIQERQAYGTHEIIRFGIVREREAEAAAFLIGRIDEGAELRLRNDLDEGHEGLTCIRRTESVYQARNGGHGWQGEWRDMDRSDVIATIESLARLNRGDGWSDCASLEFIRPTQSSL